MLNAKGKLNCPNCGAPITAEKCPYCGTLFYDFSTIDVGQPTYLKIKYNGEIVMCQAFLNECTFELKNDVSRVTQLGRPAIELITEQSVDDCKFY